MYIRDVHISIGGCHQFDTFMRENESYCVTMYVVQQDYNLYMIYRGKT